MDVVKEGVDGEWTIFRRPDDRTVIRVHQEDGRWWSWTIPTQDARVFFRSGLKVMGKVWWRPWTW